MVLLCTILLVVGLAYSLLCKKMVIALLGSWAISLFSCSSCLNPLFNNLHETIFVLYFNATSICLGAIKIGLTYDGWFVQAIS